MKNRLFVLLVISALLMSACAGSAPAAAAEEPAEEVVQEVVEEEVACELAPDLDATSDPLETICGPEDGEKWKIGFSMSYFGNGWQTQNQNSAISLTKVAPYKDNIDLIVTVAGSDVQRQNAQLNELIAQGVDALLVFPISADGLNQTLKTACDQGIVVMTYSGGVTEPCVRSVGVDYYEQGKIMAEWLVEQMEGKGKILMNHGVAGTNPEQLRNQGARDIFANYPDLEVVAETNSDWSGAVSQQAAAQALAANPTIDGVWSEGGADGVIRAMLANDMPLVPTTGEGTNGFHRLCVDSEMQAKGLSCMSTSDPAYDGAMAMKLAIAALEGYDVPMYYDIPIPTVYPDTFKVCDQLEPGCNTYPADLIPDDYFVDMFRDDLPLTLTGYITGNP